VYVVMFAIGSVPRINAGPGIMMGVRGVPACIVVPLMLVDGGLLVESIDPGLVLGLDGVVGLLETAGACVLRTILIALRAFETGHEIVGIGGVGLLDVRIYALLVAHDVLLEEPLDAQLGVLDLAAPSLLFEELHVGLQPVEQREATGPPLLDRFDNKAEAAGQLAPAAFQGQAAGAGEASFEGGHARSPRLGAPIGCSTGSGGDSPFEVREPSGLC
jgi:hypothetical protein